MIHSKRTIAAILAAVLALLLLLTACGNGDDTPTGDNSTPGVTDTETPSSIPGATDTSPDVTTEPDNTPDALDTTTPDVSETPKYIMPPYDEAQKAELDEYIVLTNNIAGIDIENVIDEIYEKYGKYINVNITKDAIRVGAVTGPGSPCYEDKGANFTGVSPAAFEKVNDFLIENGEEPLDSSNPEQNLAALWLAASLYYDPDYVHDNETYRNQPCNDIAMAFGRARAKSEGDAESARDVFWPVYVSLFGDPFDIKVNQ